MQRATTVPKNTKIDFYNDVREPGLFGLCVLIAELVTATAIV